LARRGWSGAPEKQETQEWLCDKRKSRRLEALGLAEGADDGGVLVLGVDGVVERRMRAAASFGEIGGMLNQEKGEVPP
jgi:hypothetical protein